MLIKDKISELLNCEIFGSRESNVFFEFIPESHSSDHCRVKIHKLEEFNEQVFGVPEGKLLKNGLVTYQEKDYGYCRDWASNFLKTIELHLFGTRAIANYNNIQNYLVCLCRKIKLVNTLNSVMSDKFGELCKEGSLFDFAICGDVGEEIISAVIPQESPIYHLENFDWLHDCAIDTEDEERSYNHKQLEKFFDLVLDKIDEIRLAALFTDSCRMIRKEIIKKKDGLYEIRFLNWNIWKGRDNIWLESIGELKTSSGIFSYDYLSITGTYEEINTMINLVRGDM